MIITTQRTDQTAKVTIDTNHCTHDYAIREAFRLALSLDGFSINQTNSILNECQDELKSSN